MHPFLNLLDVAILAMRLFIVFTAISVIFSVIT